MSLALSPELERLIALAREVQKRAYAPYSRFLVGAALETRSGKFFSGCNVENATYGATICAERGAIMQMVAAGERELVRVAVVTDAPEPAMPCGICRQVLVEFGTDVEIACAVPSGVRVLTLRELFPEPFRLKP
ncbi:MAG TPA: cytidine deaminase [Polyangiaceae bacterium]|nr:cytidine deaminase [Polyangiaceae bacterium]